MPVYGQSENRAIPDALATTLDAAAPASVYYTAGMVDAAGTAVGALGAGLNAIDQTKPATAFASAAKQGRVSPAFTLQYARAARWRAAGQAQRGVIIGDNGFGGRLINEWITTDRSPLGRNQLYWMRETARLAQSTGVALTCPYVYLFQGTSAKDQSAASYRADFDAAHAATLTQARTLFGAEPKLVVVVNGADINSLGDLYATPGAQYRIGLDNGGIIATWQRVFPIRDQNIHPSGLTQVLIGETCDWAIAETEAGNAWNITYAVTKSGTNVTVTFALRPGETLVDRADIYDSFGGAATCANFGFEADGGIVSAVPNLAGNSVAITLAQASAGWLRFAHQLQDCYAMTDANGVTMSAHRTTLFGSHVKASVFAPGEVLRRALPGFRGNFSGDSYVAEGAEQAP